MIGKGFYIDPLYTSSFSDSGYRWQKEPINCI